MNGPPPADSRALLLAGLLLLLVLASVPEEGPGAPVMDISEAAFLDALRAGDLSLKLHQGRVPRPGRSLSVILWDPDEVRRNALRSGHDLMTPEEQEQARLALSQRITGAFLARHPRLQLLHGTDRSPVLILVAPDRASLLALIRDPNVMLLGEDPPDATTDPL
jgi:hypothetical protein